MTVITYGPVKMTHDFAAIAGSLLGALLVVAAIELVNIQRSLGAERHNLTLMFAGEIKESALALRTNTSIPLPRRREVESRVRLYLLLNKTLHRYLLILYLIWSIDFLVAFGLLGMVINWAATEGSPRSSLTAHLIVVGTGFVMTVTVCALVLRFRWMYALTAWKERVELAERMGLPPAETGTLMRFWRRHRDPQWWLQGKR
ncbi:hypothetical protein ACH4GM_41060 [Streptomyces coeruleorubidus]|uniref:hypothetical protein n=1 Tax=Streptomyces coeruleorubidus TaxID=116188 RepID=UPI0037984E97